MTEYEKPCKIYLPMIDEEDEIKYSTYKRVFTYDLKKTKIEDIITNWDYLGFTPIGQYIVEEEDGSLCLYVYMGMLYKKDFII